MKTMNCTDVREMIADHVADHRNNKWNANICSHIQHCRTCRTFAEDCARIISILDSESELDDAENAWTQKLPTE